MKSRKIRYSDNEVYGYRIFFVVGGEVHAAEEYVEKKLVGVSVSKGGPDGRTIIVIGEKDHGVWFREVPGGGIAAHEAFHSVCHISRESGFWLNEGSEEAFAYLLGWTVREIGRHFWETRKKQFKKK